MIILFSTFIMFVKIPLKNGKLTVLDKLVDFFIQFMHKLVIKFNSLCTKFIISLILIFHEVFEVSAPLSEKVPKKIEIKKLKISVISLKVPENPSQTPREANETESSRRK